MSHLEICIYMQIMIAIMIEVNIIISDNDGGDDPEKEDEWSKENVDLFLICYHKTLKQK